MGTRPYRRDQPDYLGSGYCYRRDRGPQFRASLGAIRRLMSAGRRGRDFPRLLPASMSPAVARYFPLADQFVGRYLNCIDHLSGLAVGLLQEFILIWLALFVPSIDVP